MTPIQQSTVTLTQRLRAATATEAVRLLQDALDACKCEGQSVWREVADTKQQAETYRQETLRWSDSVKQLERQLEAAREDSERMCLKHPVDGSPVPLMGAIQSEAAARVVLERSAQHQKWGEQNHDMSTWLCILHEETGELSQAVLHERFGGPECNNVFCEAVQVAAVGLQIVEFLIRKTQAAMSETTGEKK